MSADFVPWSVMHFSGITRGSLYEGAGADAYKIADAHPIVIRRLRELYGLDLTSQPDALQAKRISND